VNAAPNPMSSHLSSFRSPFRAWLRLALLVAFVGFLAAPALAQGGFAACGVTSRSCFDPSVTEGGCAATDCCTTVCTIEPACCEVAWDDLCVAIARKFCSVCGTATNSCFRASKDKGCNTPECCSYVCSLPTFAHCCDIAWDADCAEFAKTACRGCGSPGAGSCLQVHEGAGCASVTCCERVCAADPRCCNVAWDATCVELAANFCLDCGGPLSGSCCHAQLTPYCDNPICCRLVCEVDPYCCETRWDRDCVRIANDRCGLWNCLCGDNPDGYLGLGTCRFTHPTPGCSDFDCCNEVCLLDPWCCTVNWDASCVNITQQVCTLRPGCGAVGSGSCYIRHSTPGCDDGGCCSRVCAIDPNCCEVAWDNDCVRAAERYCTDCGDVLAGSCFSPHPRAACSDRACCEAVCNTDPFCCIAEWDSLCVTIAGNESACGEPGDSCGAPGRRSCFVAGTLPGCSDPSCCERICFGSGDGSTPAIDPWCCEVRWDAACARLAIDYCQGIPLCRPGGGARGDCLVPHAPLNGCNDPLCCNAVCAIEPACCQLGWDAFCATYARTVCFGLDNCPGSEPCNRTHGTPGCEDPSCCNVVCAIDPACCSERWDINCVNLASARCTPANGSNCPCVGSCFEPHDNGGCDDPACCAGVCLLKPECCEVEWDQSCVALARVNCCGYVACGNSCAGSCFEPHPTPYCNDPSCCKAVCAIDPFCCGSRWDSSCVSAAAIRCTGLCGIAGTGSCFVAHPAPGCAEGDCCTAVCGVDPICCDASWDDCCVALATGQSSPGCGALPPGGALCVAPECGEFRAGRCCEANGTPRCENRACCEAVCQRDPVCCDTGWDQTCVSIARDVAACDCVNECGDGCAGSCCEARDTPYCNDPACCQAVCAVDPVCCDFAWDQFCVTESYLQSACSGPNGPCPLAQCGDATAGSCCSPHGGPSCDDSTCCNLVCGIDPYCCQFQWDVTCAAVALNECSVCEGGIACGSSNAGPCNQARSTPFCNNFPCCTTVCIIDKTCCQVAWDQNCVTLAAQVCAGGGLTGKGFDPKASSEKGLTQD